MSNVLPETRSDRWNWKLEAKHARLLSSQTTAHLAFYGRVQKNSNRRTARILLLLAKPSNSRTPSILWPRVKNSNQQLAFYGRG
jgi:hypothetical protein